MDDTVHNNQPTWAGNDTEPVDSLEERIIAIEEQIFFPPERKRILARLRKQPGKGEESTKGTQHRFSRHDCKP